MKTGIYISAIVAGMMFAGAAQAALVGEWNFEEGGGTLAADSSGNGYNGTITNPSFAGGVTNGSYALNCDGTTLSSIVSIPAAAFGSISNEVTVAFWAYGGANLPANNAPFGANNRKVAAHLPWPITGSTTTGTIYWDCSGSSRHTKVAEQALFKGKWNHYAFTKNANSNTNELYINGQVWGTWLNGTTNNIITGITSFFIGKNVDSVAKTYYYSGLIDNFQLYDNALSATEVSNLYASVELDYAAALIVPSRTSGYVPLEVVFNGTNSASSGTIVNYSWDFGDGNTASGPIVTNTYTAANVYTATLAVADDNGNTATNTVAITVELSPTLASIVATPTSGDIPLQVVFDGSASTSYGVGGSITNYSWNFGDGNTASGVQVTNTYYTGGSYTASLTVEDDSGHSDSNSVVIWAKDYATNVVLDVKVESSDDLNPPLFSTDDLAQTALLSSSGEGTGTSSTTANHALLFNGDLGLTNATPVRWNTSSTVTVNFDVSVNTSGYDITEISSIAGWSTAGGLGRSNQGYGVLLTYMDDSQSILAVPQNWASNSPAFYYTKVILTETSGAAMAKNVKSIKFYGFYNANAGGDVIGREIDIFGVPSSAVVASKPVISFINDGDSLSWTTDGSFLYKVQKTGDIVYGPWTTFTNVIGTRPTTSVVLPVRDQDAEFYRVIVE